MDLLVKHDTAFLNLLFAGFFAVGTLYEVAKRRSVGGVVFGLSFGAAFAALALLDLTGLIARGAAGVSQKAAVGLGLIWTSIWALYSPPSPTYPNWTKWAWLIIGIGWTLSAIYVGLIYYFENGL